MTKAEHDATTTAFREWSLEKFGRKVGAKIDWKQVSPREVFRLSERMFDAAGISRFARNEYYAEFTRYIYSLI